MPPQPVSSATDGGTDDSTDTETDPSADDDRVTLTSLQAKIVAALDVDAKTAKRAQWERWEFTIEAPYQIRVVNASYPADERDDHAYVVHVAEAPGGLLVPEGCSCPAFQYRDGDCKHQLAVALHGGPPLLGAAVAYTEPKADGGRGPFERATTLADKLAARGGNE